MIILIYYPTSAPTPAPQQPTIFYVFVNQMNNAINLINENENKNKLKCKCKFKNVICNFDFNDCNSCNSCNGYLPTTCRTPYPTPDSPRPKPFEFANLRKPVLNNVFNDICNGIGFVYDGNNNENFYDIVLDYCELSPYISAVPRPTTVDFEGIDTRVSGINILECEFGVYLCERNITSEIFNGMINGMWYYLFRFLFLRCSFPLGELGPPEPLSKGVFTVCCFFKFLAGQPGGETVESERGEEQEAELFGILFYFVYIILARKSCLFFYNICYDEKKNMAEVGSELVIVF